MKRIVSITALGAGLLLWAPTAHSTDYPADNSGKNVRDRQDTAKTAGSQSNAASDVNITQKIRQAVIADEALSTNAHNVKIVTAKGVVTLRGPVRNTEEKTTIGAKALTVAGVTRVDNQIEIASD